jgi:dUTPase
MRPRSSQGKIGLVSGTGVIDNGYNGPLGYYLTNTSRQVYEYQKGDKIGQLILIPMHPFFGEMEEISEDQIPITERGSTGFGSTGK